MHPTVYPIIETEDQQGVKGPAEKQGFLTPSSCSPTSSLKDKVGTRWYTVCNTYHADNP